MTERWPKVRLGEVLHLDLDKVSVDPSVTYPMVGVYSFGRGLFDREPIVAGNTSYRYFYRLKRDHVVMSQLFGWEGALALSSEEFEGKYVSPQFPTFLCEEGLLDRQFLGWMMRRSAFWDDLGRRASGMGDRRRTLNPNALFACEIPLPPLDEQRRIVARIQGLAAKVEEAQGLRRGAVKEGERLLICMAHRLDWDEETRARKGWRLVRLGDCIREVDDSHVVDAEKSYPNLGIYSFGRGLFHKPPIEGVSTSAKKLRRVQVGQFIYSRLFAFEGAYGVVSKDFDGYYVSNEYPTFECNPALVRAEFLEAYFKSPDVWKHVAVGSKGLGDRRQRVQPAQVLQHRLWVPPLAWQDRLAEVRSEINRSKDLQADAALELDALLPSVLDNAFRGEL